MKNRIKVLHLINGDVFGGAERVQELLIKEMNKTEKYEIYIVATKKGDFLNKSKLKESKYLHFFYCPFKKILDFKALIHRFKPDVVHCHTPISLFYFKLIKFNSCRVVYHVHSPALRDTPNKVKNCIKYLIEKFSFDNMRDFAICVSDSVRGQTPFLNQKNDNVFVVHNGVKIQKYNKVNSESSTKLKIGFAGLIRERKGLEILISALTKLDFQPELHVLGDFDCTKYQKDIFDLIEKHDQERQVIFHGFVSDVIGSILNFDVFVIPSLYGEGLPMVLLESMSVGVPVIASNIDGIPEAIEHNQNGLLFNAGDSTELAIHINNYFKDEILKDKLARNSLQTQQNSFSVNAMYSKISEIYEHKQNSN